MLVLTRSFETQCRSRLHAAVRLATLLRSSSGDGHVHVIMEVREAITEQVVEAQQEVVVVVAIEQRVTRLITSILTTQIHSSSTE